ncbi:hypothetical protein SteCoe_11605 [Stentor coeruleus]|uniref:EF-hand domain-containing protein n=1 Tax=Stentor coeruleus TaxID=5963 RepID=A0A1R2CCU8_9CILI|nr:hypothetical protein SteCoe_11605 [Stentor coeruleus]
MGCTTCRKSNLTIEESVLLPLERSLGFSKFPSVEVDRILYRHSNLCKMSEPQLRKACKNLLFDYKDMKFFFARFSDGELFYTRKLNCVGIILGKGSDDIKASLLFKNYDVDISQTLDKNEIETLVGDILTVSCRIIPGYAVSIDPGNKELIEYASKISQVEKVLIKHYSNLLLENHTYITEKEFYKAFKIDAVRYLLYSSDMRKYAFDIYSKIERPAKIVIGRMNSIDTNEHSEIFDRIEKKRNQTKRSLSCPP